MSIGQDSTKGACISIRLPKVPTIAINLIVDHEVHGIEIAVGDNKGHNSQLLQPA